MDSVCFANVAEVSWLKIKTKKPPQLFKKEGKNLHGRASRQEPMAAWQGCTGPSAGETAGPRYVRGLPGPAVPQARAGRLHGAWGLHVAIKDGSVSAIPRRWASEMQSKSASGQVWVLSISVRSRWKKTPREQLLVVLDPVPSPPAVSRRFPSDLTEDSGWRIW